MSGPEEIDIGAMYDAEAAYNAELQAQAEHEEAQRAAADEAESTSRNYWTHEQRQNRRPPMSEARKVTVKQDEHNSIPVEVLAKSIVDISRGMNTVLNGPLKRSAIVLLIQNSSGVSRTDINHVLDAIADLEKQYVRTTK